MEEVRCTNCNRIFCIEPEEILRGIKNGEEFPCGCPLCEDGKYVVLINQKGA